MIDRIGRTVLGACLAAAMAACGGGGGAEVTVDGAKVAMTHAVGVMRGGGYEIMLFNHAGVTCENVGKARTLPPDEVMLWLFWQPEVPMLTGYTLADVRVAGAESKVKPGTIPKKAGDKGSICIAGPVTVTGSSTATKGRKVTANGCAEAVMCPSG